MTSALSTANFHYADPANDAARVPLALSLYADRPHLRALMADDAAAAGFRIGEAAGIVALLEGDARPLGDVVLVDCSQVACRGTGPTAALPLPTRKSKRGGRQCRTGRR